MSKSKSKAKISKSALPAPVAASALDALLPIAGGAIVTILALVMLKFGAAEIWSPFARSGATLFKVLIISVLAGGIAATVLGRRFNGPIAATASALGWALWGLWLHWSAQGQYLDILQGGLPAEAMGFLLFTNAISQSLCVAFALFVASILSWYWSWRRRDELSGTIVTDDDLEGNGIQSFATALVYPLATIFGGLILLNLFGSLALPLGDPPVEQLPSNPAVAAVCGALTMSALFVTTFIARRTFRALSSVGDIALAPLVIALVAVFAREPLLHPAALLIWRTSAFEMASWAALGASLGYYYARISLKIK